MLNPVFRLETPASLGLKVIAFTLHGLDNQHYSPRLLERLRSLRASFDPSHSLTRQHGFQALRQLVERSLRRFPPSPLTLFEQNRRHGQLRPISPVVDLYNQWSLNSGLSIGAHDLQRLQLPVRLTLTAGGETFQPLGRAANEDPDHLPAGEYAYLDARDQVICRMEYRQAAASAVQPDSRAILMIVQGLADTPDDYLRSVAAGLKNDLLDCCTPALRHAS